MAKTNKRAFDIALGKALQGERIKAGYARRDVFAAAVEERTGAVLSSDAMGRIERGEQPCTVEQYAAILYTLEGPDFQHNRIIETALQTIDNYAARHESEKFICDMMDSFADSIEHAQKEQNSPFEIPEAVSRIVEAYRAGRINDPVQLYDAYTLTSAVIMRQIIASVELDANPNSAIAEKLGNMRSAREIREYLHVPQSFDDFVRNTTETAEHGENITDNSEGR